MKVLITGATGFIGGRAIEHFLNLGNDIIATGRKRDKESPSNNKIKWMLGNLEDRAFCELLLSSGVEAVIHCAGKAGLWGDHGDFERANIHASSNLVKIAKQYGVHRFVFLSTPSIYIDLKDQYSLKETDLPRNFINSYAQTKYIAEQIVLKEDSPGFRTVALRPRLVIGAGDQQVLPRIIEGAKRGNLRKVGDGRNLASVTHIKNLLMALERCLVAPGSAMGRAYNISDGADVNFWDFVNHVLDSVGVANRPSRPIPRQLAMAIALINEKACRFVRCKSEPGLLPVSIATLSQSMTLDISDAINLLSYEPRFTTSDGVAEFSSWWTLMSIKSKTLLPNELKTKI